MEPYLLEPIARPLDLRLALPGSKSFANRAIVCALLSGAPCTVANLSPADDTALMLNVAADLGWRVTRSNPLATDVRLAPPAKPYAPPHEIRIHAGAAGTVARFALALLTVMPGRFVLDGDARLRQRPMAALVDALQQLGAVIGRPGRGGPAFDRLVADGAGPSGPAYDSQRDEGYRLPLAIEGASLRGGRCVLRGDVSSQFVSALLLVAPARGVEIEIEIESELVSKPYVDMTLEVMRAFSFSVERDGYRRFRVSPGEAPGDRGRGAHATYVCPPDATAAGYFWGAAAVAGGRCVVDGLTRQDSQADVRLVDVFARVGCRVLEFPDGLGVEGPVGELRAVEADMSAMPDSAQTLAVVCALARGKSRLTGLRTLRVKETDRVAALESELRKLGAVTRAGDDWLEIEGAQTKMPEPLIHTFEDHRMAMSFAIAGLRSRLRIENPGCVSKSFPAFWEYWKLVAPKQEPPA